VKKFKAIFRNPLTWIFLLALIIRIYKLGVFPFGFQYDEVKVGWNALSILKTARDDQENFLALYYNTFGDYRPTGIFYLTIPSVAAFGRSVFAVRLPSALIGALTVFPLYLLTLFTVGKEKLRVWKLNSGHIAAILLVLSPWHIEVSRATSEVSMSMFFALFALFFFIKLIKTKKIKFAILSIIFILISSLLYHSIRVLAPPFYFIILWIYRKEFKRNKFKKVIYLCFAIVTAISIYFAASNDGRQRFDQVSIFNDPNIIYEINRIRSENLKVTLYSKLFDNRATIYIRNFALEYSKYFGGDFLLGNSAKPYRYVTPGTGLLNYIEVVFLILGLAEIARGKKTYFPLIMLLLAPIPAALTIDDAPNLHRALLMLPFLIMIEAYGIQSITNFKKKYVKKIILIAFLALILNSSYFFYMYFHHGFSYKPFIENLSIDSPTYRDVGTQELVNQLDSLKKEYGKIVITNFPSSPYSWYAFFTGKDPGKINPLSFLPNTNERDWENIVFSQQKCPSDDAFTKYKDQKLLVIDSGECAYMSEIKDGLPGKITKKMVRTDGTVIYVFLEKN